MSDQFFSSRYSIEHAKRHITELDGEAVAFFNSNPYSKVVELSADGTEDLHKIKLIKPMPIALSGIAFDALNNLRSALDQAGYSIGIASKTKGKNSHFPFGDSLDEVQSRIGSTSKDLPKDIFDLMVSFKPYKGGNNLLWALNKLCNSHKHEIIIPMAVATGRETIQHAAFQDGFIGFMVPRWNRAKNEMTVVRLKHATTHYNIDLQIDFFIALAKVDVVDGQPAVGVLNNLVGIVDGIVSGVEAEAKRIGLI
jgi:hypothetical protein